MSVWFTRTAGGILQPVRSAQQGGERNALSDHQLKARVLLFVLFATVVTVALAGFPERTLIWSLLAVGAALGVVVGLVVPDPKGQEPRPSTNARSAPQNRNAGAVAGIGVAGVTVLLVAVVPDDLLLTALTYILPVVMVTNSYMGSRAARELFRRWRSRRGADEIGSTLP